MDAEYRSEDGFYYVAVKRPLSYVTDWKAKQIKGKKTVYTIKVNDETVVRIYRVEDQSAADN